MTDINDRLGRALDRLEGCGRLELTPVTDALTTEELERDILSLSSGTVASLTGLRGCSEIDDLTQSFLACAVGLHRTRNYRSWQEAWRDFADQTERQTGTRYPVSS